MLLARDLPTEGESLHGYLARLAFINGRKSLSALLREYGESQLAPLLSVNPFDKHHFFELIKQMTGADAELLNKAYGADIDLQWLYSDMRMIRTLRIKRPRICCSCMSDKEAIIPFKWSLLPVTHCEKHSERLIDICPSCSAPLKWHSSLFEGRCHKCGVFWNGGNHETIPVDTLEFLEMYQAASVSSEWITEFTVNLIKTARPYDQYHDSIDAIPEGDFSINDLVLKSYGVTEGLNEYPPKGFVKPRRLKHQDSLHFHVKHDRVAEELKIPTLSVKPFVDAGLILPLTDTPLVRDQIFDLRNATNLMSSLPTKPEDADTIVVSQGDQILEIFGCCFEDILACAIKAKSCCLIANSEGQMSFAISRSVLVNLLNANLIKLEGTHLKETEVTKILCLENHELEELIKSKKIERVKDSRKCSQFDGRSISALLKLTPERLIERQRKIDHLISIAAISREGQ